MDFINASMGFLYNLGAVDADEELQKLGYVLAKLPVDAIVGKMLILSVVSCIPGNEVHSGSSFF